MKNAGAMFVGQVGRVVLQGAYFFIVARSLGAADFGAFAATVALAALIAPFGSLGSINLMIQHIVDEVKSPAVQFATAVKVTTAAGLCMLLFITALSPLVTPASLTVTLVAAMAFSELLCARQVEVAAAVYTGLQRMGTTARLLLAFNAVRLAGAVALTALPVNFSLANWIATYLMSSAVAAAGILMYVRRDVGPARADMKQFRGEWRQGLLFAVGLSSQTAYNDIDKVMLARISTLEATGIYSAAYRVIDFSFTPLRALLSAAYPRFFLHGQKGLANALSFTRRLAVPCMGYGIFATASLLLFAELIPIVLGSDYESAVSAVRAMAVIPLLKALHYLAADTLTGSRMQGARSAAQLGVAALNIALNVVLIPKFGYNGAIVASIASDAALGLALWTIIVVRVRGPRSHDRDLTSQPTEA